MNVMAQPCLLALDTSNQYCSVALQTPTRVDARHEWSEQKHSQMILPLVRELMQANGVDWPQVDAIVVGIGPGGFTGVRLAVAVAQGLAFAAQKPVIALPSLDALAQTAVQHGVRGDIVVAMDARMQQVYWARYSCQEGLAHARIEPRLDDVAVLADYLRQPEHACALVGNAAAVFETLTQISHSAPIFVPEMDHAAPHAADLLPLANHRWAQGQCISPEQLQPLYVRDKVALTIAERMQNQVQKP